MEYQKKERESVLKGKPMSSNDRVKNWCLSGCREKDDNLYGRYDILQPQKPSKKVVSENPAEFEPKRKTNEDERRRRSKSPKKNGLYIEFKPFKKSKTAREVSENRSDMKRFKKVSDKIKRKNSLLFNWVLDGKVKEKKKPSNFHNTWEHTDFISVPTYKNLREKEKRGRKPDKVKRMRHKSNQWSEKELKKNSSITDLMDGGKKKKMKKEMVYPVFNCLATYNNQLDEHGGKAIVIYQRENRRNFVHPHTGDGYKFEQISFSGSCEATINYVQSKRSLSEPRKNSLKEFYVARRKTRFQLDPNKMASSTQCDCHSNLQSFKPGSNTIEFKKFEGVRDGFQLYSNPINECEKFDDDKKLRKNLNQKQAVLYKSKSTTDSTWEVGKRLQQTADKKLDLHKEMIRAEKNNKKKFWESIERSLNYRCALADMFSSQSFLAQNKSSKFFSSTDNSTGHSTGIYVRESVIEKISSYQGFHRFLSSSAPSASRKRANIRSMTPPPTSPYRQMKTVLGSILIKEDERESEEAILINQNLKDFISSCSSSGSSLNPEDTPYETTGSILPQTTSEKFTLMESTLGSDFGGISEVEVLMAKLSEEIRKCSNVMKVLNQTVKSPNRLLPKCSLSDSRMEIEKMPKKPGNQIPRKEKQYAAFPVNVYVVPESDNKREDEQLEKFDKRDFDKTDDLNQDNADNQDNSEKREKSSKSLNNFDNKEKQEGSDDSLHSFENSSIPSSTKTRYPRNEYKSSKGKDDFVCCDDCKYLKRRIVKLEQELERLEKRIPLYPREYQDSIKSCLERLKTTSETVLKRLRSCTKLRYSCERQSKKAPKSCDTRSRRATSAPASAVHKSSQGKLDLRGSNSDYTLNVGMEITMENADPDTGEKLLPEVADDCQQEGNIKCKITKDGEDPVLIMDTDFKYNPNTGMLFKTDSSSPTSSKHQTPNHKSGQRGSIKKTHSDMVIARTTEYQNASKKAFNTFDINFDGNKDPFVEKKKVISNNRIEKERNPSVGKFYSCHSVDTEKKHHQDPIEKKREEMKEKFRSRSRSRSISRKRSSCRDIPEKKSDLKILEESMEMEEKQKPGFAWTPRKVEMKAEPKREVKSRIPTRKKPPPNAYKSSYEIFVQKFNAASQSSCNSDCTQDRSNLSVSMSNASEKLAKLFSFTWTFGFFLCKLVHYMQSVSAICSVLTLTAMSLERYYAIVHPMKAQYICTISQARRIITGTWISAFLLAVPILFAQVHLRVGVKVEAYWCVRDWDNKIIWRAHELYMMLLILVIPTGVMAVAYTAICWEIWEVLQRRQDMTSGKGDRILRKPRFTRTTTNDSFPSSLYTNNYSKNNHKKRSKSIFKRETADDRASVKQVIKMLVAVVVIYVICWGPMLIDNVLQAYGILSHIRMGWLKYMGTAFHLMAYFNSCINPIIYGFMSKNFRESFMKTLCCVGKKPKTALQSFSLSQTRNTSIRYAESSFSRTVSIALPV